jgi:hypothetical protein
MRVAFLSYIIASILTACGTIEDNAWVKGVSREDALDIRRAVIAQKGAHTITDYERQPDGSILVYTDVGDFAGHRVNGKWIFQIVVITS